MRPFRTQRIYDADVSECRLALVTKARRAMRPFTIFLHSGQLMALIDARAPGRSVVLGRFNSFHTQGLFRFTRRDGILVSLH